MAWRLLVSVDPQLRAVTSVQRPPAIKALLQYRNVQVQTSVPTVSGTVARPEVRAAVEYRATKALLEYPNLVATIATNFEALFEVLNDRVGILEQLSISTETGFAVGAAVQDAIYLALTRSTADTAALTDTVARTVSKVFADTAVIADSANVVADSAEGVFDALSILETVEVNLTKNLDTDSVSLVDAGSMLRQSYADFSYFAEDYVGDRFNF